mgnify:CR=1 FL=1
MIMSPQQLRRYAEGGAAEPYIAGITKQERSMDPLVQQMLYGLDGQGGFIPGAMRAAERTFFDDQGRPLVTPQEIARFSPDQQAAFQMAREQVGSQQPFLQASQEAYEKGLGALGQGQQQQLASQERSLQELQRASGIQDYQSQRGLGDALGGIDRGQREMVDATNRLRSDIDEQGQVIRQSGERFSRDLGGMQDYATGSERQFSQDVGQATTTLQGAQEKLNQELNQALGQERGAVDRFTDRQGEATSRLGSAVDRFGNRLSDAEQRGIGAVDDYSAGLDESREMLRGSLGAYDPSSTDAYMNPYEDKVVGQMIQDATKGLAQSDMMQTASDIRSGGESAFGSRARLTAEERAEAMGRGLAKEVGGLRAQGFQNAQSTAMNEFARQQQAQKGAAEGLASLGGQGLTAQSRAADTLSQGAASRLTADQSVANRMSQEAAGDLAANRSIADRLAASGTQRFGAGQSMASQQQGAAQSTLGARQNLASTMGSVAQQRLAADRSGAEGIGNLSGERYGAGTNLGQSMATAGMNMRDARSQMGNQAMQTGATIAQGYGQMGQLQGNIGQQQLAAQQGYGGFIQGLGSAQQAAGQQQMNNLMNVGAQQQALQQQQYDAQRAGLLQAQQAPLNQYNALMPFVDMGVKSGGETQIGTTYTPPPSALQAGLATGLGALGAVGTYMNPQGRT